MKAAAFILLAAAPLAAASFPPLEVWKAAVMAGDATALAKLYSTNPEAFAQFTNTRVALKDEWAFWASMKRNGLTEFNPRVLEVSNVNGNTRLVLRISAASGNLHLYAGVQQVWAQQPGGWKIVASSRGNFEVEAVRRLPQPAVPNTNLYSDPKEAEKELKEGLARAAREHKRVIVVFGGNWCYDCHVLDTTFHSKDFAPLVDASFVVVHINIGDEGKDNTELAKRLGVALDKGVPSLGVLEADGRVVYAQKNGEFESTIKTGPDDVRAFLEKWKKKS
ncbi:MAG TPA: thioredoxin family protein [Bryobacteraceae bacterium]|nr:thioredoxin family protein [Bryobacteraceae bacterium]